MCKYCENYYSGDSFFPIHSQTIAVGIFGRVSVESYIGKTDAGNPALIVGVCPSNGMAVEQQKTIRYCPMCGNRLIKD